MILVLFPDDSPETRAEEEFGHFADVIHSRVPHDHSIDLHAESRRDRGICGDCDIRVVPTRQGLCPQCGSSLHDAENIERMRVMAKRLRAECA